jgi:hypothetical protein
MKRLFLPFLLILLFISSTFAQTVHITKTGNKYHTAGCSYLRSDIQIDLKEAVNRGYTPCSRCNPPILTSSTQSSNKNHNNTSTLTQNKSEIKSGRCQAITKKGTQCKRKAKPGSIYCWQHGG